MLKPLNVHAKEKVEPRGGAETCILLFLQGGPSQLETFSAKEGALDPAGLRHSNGALGSQNAGGLVAQAFRTRG